MTARPRGNPGCMPGDTRLLRFNGESITLEDIETMWVSNLDPENIIDPPLRISQGYIVDFKARPFVRIEPGGPSMPAGANAVLPIEALKKHVPETLYSVDGAEVYPIFKVVGTETQPLMKVDFDHGPPLHVTAFHPILTQGNTITAAAYLKPGDTVVSRTGLRQVDRVAPLEDRDPYKVWNLALGSRDVFELIKSILISLLEAVKEQPDDIARSGETFLFEAYSRLDSGQRQTLAGQGFSATGQIKTSEDVAYELAKGIVNTQLKSFKQEAGKNFLGLRRRNHVIFTEDALNTDRDLKDLTYVATGSYTPQIFLELGKEPYRFFGLW